MERKIKTKIKFCILIIIYICFGHKYVLAEISVDSPVAIVMETSTKRILFEKNIYEKRKIASTTKLMTAMITLDKCKLTDTVTISKNAASVGGSTVGLIAGEEVTVESLLYGLMLESGNDCAVALAEHISTNISDFACLMNEKAKSIGALNTNYTNPHGLDTEDNYCTAYDLALIARETLNYPKLIEIMGTKEIVIKVGKSEKYYSNTNRLLDYEYCIAGKTGFTNGANRCIVTIAKQGDLQVITVVLGSETTQERFGECKRLMQYALDVYKMVDISHSMNWYISIPVYKGNIEKYEKYITDNLVLPLKEGEEEKIYVKQTILPVITTPIYKGAVLGDTAMYIEDEKIYSTEIILETDILKNNMWYYIQKGMREMFNVKVKI